MTVAYLTAVRRIGETLPRLLDALGRAGEAGSAGLAVASNLATLAGARLRAVEAQEVRMLRHERGAAGHADPTGDTAVDSWYSQLGDALAASERAVRRADASIGRHTRAVVDAREAGELAKRAVAIDAEHTLRLVGEGFATHAAVLDRLAARVIDGVADDDEPCAPPAAVCPEPQLVGVVG